MDGDRPGTRRVPLRSPHRAVAGSARETSDRTARPPAALVRPARRPAPAEVSSVGWADSTVAMTSTRPRRTRAPGRRYLTLRIGSIASSTDLLTHGSFTIT